MNDLGCHVDKVLEGGVETVEFLDDGHVVKKWEGLADLGTKNKESRVST